MTDLFIYLYFAVGLFLLGIYTAIAKDEVSIDFGFLILFVWPFVLFVLGALALIALPFCIGMGIVELVKKLIEKMSDRNEY